MKYSLLGLLTVALIIIKILKLSTLSWWWVFSPIWLTLGLSLVIFVLLAAVYIWSKFDANNTSRR